MPKAHGFDHQKTCWPLQQPTEMPLPPKHTAQGRPSHRCYMADTSTAAQLDWVLPVDMRGVWEYACVSMCIARQGDRTSHKLCRERASRSGGASVNTHNKLANVAVYRDGYTNTLHTYTKPNLLLQWQWTRRKTAPNKHHSPKYAQRDYSACNPHCWPSS
mgnify:CR=1 FL=1